MALVLPSAIARNTCSGAVSLSSVHVRRGERAVPKAARERPTRSSTPYVQCVRAIVAIPASSTDRVCCGFSSASGIQLGQASSWVPRPRCPGHLISDAWVPLQLATVAGYFRYYYRVVVLDLDLVLPQVTAAVPEDPDTAVP
jgi:hypothetical protein